MPIVIFVGAFLICLICCSDVCLVQKTSQNTHMACWKTFVFTNPFAVVPKFCVSIVGGTSTFIRSPEVVSKHLNEVAGNSFVQK